MWIFQRALDSKWVRWSVLLFLVPLLITDAAYAYFIPRTWIGGIDLHVYVAAAQIGVTHGWGHIYDSALQRPLIRPLFVHAAGLPAGYWTPYVTPPPVAWVLGPVAMLPFSAVWGLWSLTVAGAVVAGALLLSDSNVKSRVFLCLLLLATPNTILGVVAGNVWTLIFFALAMTWYLVRRGHPLVAGGVLAIIILKPQVAWLVVPALAIAGYWRVVLGFSLVASVGALASAFSLGIGGLTSWRSLAGFVSTFHGEAAQSLPRIMPNVWLGALVVLGAIVLSLTCARLGRAGGAGVPIAAGIIGSLFIAPYLNSYDFGLLIVAGLLIVREERNPALQVCGWVLAASATVAGVGLGMAVVAAGMTCALVSLFFAYRANRGGTQDQDVNSIPKAPVESLLRA